MLWPTRVFKHAEGQLIIKYKKKISHWYIEVVGKLGLQVKYWLQISKQTQNERQRGSYLLLSSKILLIMMNT